MAVNSAEHRLRRLRLSISVRIILNLLIVLILQHHTTQFSLSCLVLIGHCLPCRAYNATFRSIQVCSCAKTWLLSVLIKQHWVIHGIFTLNIPNESILNARILSSDPGFVKCGPLTNNEANLEGSELPSSDICEASASAESSLLLQRVRYCKHCDAHVKGFDHHCPAFGNCIGRNNHLLFMILLTGFIIAEACYIVGASQFATSRTPDSSGWTETLATSTMIFSLLQVLWQAVFLGWHIYCVCFNIKTDEWIHWKHYPEFQYTADPQPGETVTSMRFKNPYDKGIWLNLKEFIEAKG